MNQRMNTNNNSLQAERITPISAALTLAGGVIGPSFATGKEILVYFGNFSLKGFAGIIIAFLTLGVVLYMSFCIAKNMDKYTFEWQLSPRGWKPLRYFFKWLTIVGMFLAVSSMFAAAGSVVRYAIEAPAFLGALFMAAAVFISSHLDIKELSVLMKKTVPAMVSISAIVCIICVINPEADVSGWYSIESTNPLIGGWLTSGLIYCGYNTGAVRAIVPTMAGQIKSKKLIVKSLLLLVLILTAAASFTMAALIVNYSICASEDMPVIALAYTKSSVLGGVYSAAALVAIYNTCVTSTQILKNSMSELEPIRFRENSVKPAIAIVLFAAFGLSFVGISVFVDRIWAVLGYTAYLGIGFLTYNFFHYTRHPNIQRNIKNQDEGK